MAVFTHYMKNKYGDQGCSIQVKFHFIDVYALQLNRNSVAKQNIIGWQK